MKPIMFDMDGVLADFICGFTSLAHDLFGYNSYSTESQQKWDFDHMQERHVREVWDEIKASSTFWTDLPSLMSGNEQLRLEQLCARYDVYFCTSRPGIRTREQTQGFLEARGVYNPAVIVLPTLATKGEMAHALGAEYSIEDKAGNAVCIDYMSKAKSYLIDRPYNQFNHEALGSNVRRIITLEQYFDDIEEGK